MLYLRRLVAAAAAGVVLAVSGGVAWAHVDVTPSVALKGEFPTLMFRVPNERSGGDVNKVQIFFPTNTVLPFVLVKPPEGWKWEVERGIPGRPRAVVSVTFHGGKIPKGHFELFGLEPGPMPEDLDELRFVAHVGFTDGTLIKFDQPWPKGGPEPAAAAPHVRLVDDITTVVTSDVAAARRMGQIGVGVGALGLLVGSAALALAFTRRRGEPGAPAAAEVPAERAAATE